MPRTSFDDPRLRRPVLTVLWLLAVAVVASLAFRYWIPLDDGTLAHSAERVLAGQLPHRDFGDPYTGLNALLGALAFRMFGVTLSSLRVPLVAGFALWLPGMFVLMRRFCGPGSAALLTAVAAVASVLAYPAAMPTWFALFAVTWGLVALLRFLAYADRRWLAVCGAAAGVAVLFKIVGLYFLAAALLALAGYRRLRDAQVALSAGALAVFLILVGRLVLPGSGAPGAYHFFLPVAVLVVWVLRRGDRDGEPDARGLHLLFGDLAALLGGFAVPVAVFLVPYVVGGAGAGDVGGSVAALVRGVLVLPTRRLAAAASAPPRLWTAIPGLTAVAVLEIARRAGPARGARLAWTVVGALAVALALDDFLGDRLVTVVWWAARGWLPALVLWGAWILHRRPHDAPPSRAAARARVEAFAVLATAALWGLVQFPYTAPAYFFYVAPLLVPATLAVVRQAGGGAASLSRVYAGLFLLVAAGYVTGVMRSADTPLELDRGGIRVSAADAALYGQLVPLVRARARGGPILATPDLPHVYFLTGLANPTSVLYEFLDPTATTEESRLRTLAESGVRVVVLNHEPIFSSPPSPGFSEEIRTRYPQGRRMGPLEVRWRKPPSTPTLPSAQAAEHPSGASTR